MNVIKLMEGVVIVMFTTFGTAHLLFDKFWLGAFTLTVLALILVSRNQTGQDDDNCC